MIAAAVLAMAVLVVACGGNDGPSTSPSETAPITNLTLAPPETVTTGGTLKFGLDAETTTGWDPANSQWAASGTIVARSIFDRLAEWDANSVAQPNLASAITSNADLTVWTITLRPGIVFHNGEPLNAQVVKLNLDRAKTSVLLGAALSSFMDTTEVVDDLHVVVKAKKPWSTFPSSMATQAGTMAAPEQLTSSTPAQDPIGTGPFVFENWVPDNKLTVSRNPSYWKTDGTGQQLPYLDAIEFSVLSDQSSRGAALQSGSVDAINTFEPELINRFIPEAEQGNVQMISNANAEEATQFVGLNTTKAPFDDPLARRLLATGLDTELISQTQYFGLYPPSTGFFPTDSPYYTETSYPQYDPALATQMAQEYEQKYGHPLQFTLNLPSSPQFKSIGEAAQAQAAQFGTEVTLNLVDQATLIVDALTGNFEATGFITFGEPPIDQIFISQDTLQPVGKLSLNFTRYSDPEIQTALATIQSTQDEAVQIEQWKIIQERMAQDLNFIFVVRNRTAVVYATDVWGLADATLPGGGPVKPTTSPFLAWAWMT